MGPSLREVQDNLRGAGACHELYISYMNERLSHLIREREVIEGMVLERKMVLQMIPRIDKDLFSNWNSLELLQLNLEPIQGSQQS